MKIFLAATLLLSFCLTSTVVRAESLDLQTSNLVIEKLDRLLETLDTDSTAKVPMSLRLADLHADRARLLEVNQELVKARTDRLQAVELYKSIFNNLDKDQKSKVLAQMAHLYELTVQTFKAQELYKNVVAHENNYSPELISQSCVGLGEMEFNLAHYKKAEKDFKKALKFNEARRKPYINSRLAWSYFHEGQLDLAKQTIYGTLTSPETTDNSFKEEASRDYSTFLSQGKVSQTEIKKLADASPEPARKENLVYLASELDRLGKKSEAVAVWKVVGEENHTEAGDLSEHFRLAQLQYDLNHKDGAVVELDKTISIWKSQGCKAKEENCDLLQAKMKKMITDWAAAEEREPSIALIKACSIYLSQFPDLELSYWAAQAARKAGLFREAIGFYRSASEFAKSALKNKEPGKAATLFEGACLGEIEVAELSKDNSLRDQAYNHYLNEDPNGVKILDVRYQKAHLLYEQKNFSKSAVSFHDIAVTDNSKELTLREKAADISIEALIASKEEANLEVWALEYSKLFKSREPEYQKIARDAVINHESSTINNDQASTSALENSLEKLNKADLSKASNNEKRTYFKDRLIVSEKLQNVAEVNKAADGLLAIKPLSKEDKELALSRKEWAAELTLNFSTAFSIAKQMKMPKLSYEERLLKLAMFAELSNHNPDSYYLEFIRVSKNKAATQSVMAKLIRKSINPYAQFIKFLPKLKLNSALTATLALEIFGKTHDYKLADSIVKNRKLRSTPAGQTIYRFTFLRDFSLIKHLMSHSQLSSKSPQKLKETLTTRMTLIRQTENQAKHAIRTGDWTLELITLDAVKRQNERLAFDITKLPVPKNLKGAERKQYQELIAKQAAPYNRKAQEVSSKLNQLWSNANVNLLLNEVKTAKGLLKNVIIQEIKFIAQFAPQEKRADFQDELNKTLADANVKPATESVREAREMVQASPFNAGKIEKLKDLESQAGHETYANYLDGRLAQLQRGEKL
jgi:hypothetical protein